MRSLIKRWLTKYGVEVHYRDPKRRLNVEDIGGRNKTLVAGPFLGEFGWELMQWQGYVRRLSRFYERTIVYGRESSRYFYEDFATEFRTLSVNSWDTNGYELNRFDYDSWANGFESCDLLVADNRCKILRNLFDQELVPFGKFNGGNAYDIVIHARAIPKLDGNKSKWTRNWPEEYWDELCGSFSQLRVAAVGVADLAYAPKNVVDLRSVVTDELCSILASSRVCIGPSSGVMHLASLCKTPHVVWTSEENTWGFGGLAFRYRRSWNPFATNVLVLDEMGWQPNVAYIRENLRRFLGPQYSRSI